MNLLIILISSMLVNNFVLSRFLGICPFLGVSKRTDTAMGMGLAVIFVITISSNYLSLLYPLYHNFFIKIEFHSNNFLFELNFLHV